ncbi:MAG TPA: hypothetical protein DDW30_02860 [Clostridiales bacterium]|nr:hypothetical protein [Clostridiales bacterium]
MTLGERLKSIRNQAGLSQEQLAEKLKVSRQAVTKWETDAGIPDIENMKAISVLFHVSVDELLFGETGTVRGRIRTVQAVYAPMIRTGTVL